MTHKLKAYPLRLPDDLKAWAEDRSIRNFRSVNAEIVAILAAIRAGENTGDGFEKFANPSAIPV